MITADRISLLQTNRDEIVKLTTPYYDKIEADIPLNHEETDRLDNLIMQYGTVCDEIDLAWNRMVIRKTSIIKRIFRKN